MTPPRRFHRNFEQILTWSVVSAPLWIGGALAVDGARWVLWLAAMGIDLAAAGPVLAAEVGAHPQ